MMKFNKNIFFLLHKHEYTWYLLIELRYRIFFEVWGFLWYPKSILKLIFWHEEFENGQNCWIIDWFHISVSIYSNFMFISSLNELFKAKKVCIFFTEHTFDAEKFASFSEHTFDAENLFISFPKILINRYQ